MEEGSYDHETFDLARIITTNNVVSMFQSGNFLQCMTDKGQQFRQAIPAGKILNKDTEGNWVLEDMNIRV